MSCLSLPARATRSPTSRERNSPRPSVRFCAKCTRSSPRRWSHAACFLPIEDYPLYRGVMTSDLRSHGPSFRRHWAWLEQNREVVTRVLTLARERGEIKSSDFKRSEGKSGGWWDWKPAKLVLEDLLDQGAIMCASRTPGFARLYDLSERVLPSDLDVSDPGQLESTRHLLLRGLAGLGVATAAEMADYFRLKPADNPRAALASLVEDGSIVPVEVEGWRERAFASSSALERDMSVPQHRPTLLAPFDNLMWERSRVERIFGFRYRVEIYVPESKRQYGYFVLPLLARGQLGGRADLKLDRKSGLLHVLRLWLEGAEPAEAHSAFEDLARHLGARDID